MRKVNALPLDKRLILAGHLMAEGKGDIAVTITETVVAEYQAVWLFAGRPA